MADSKVDHWPNYTLDLVFRLNGFSYGLKLYLLAGPEGIEPPPPSSKHGILSIELRAVL